VGKALTSKLKKKMGNKLFRISMVVIGSSDVPDSKSNLSLWTKLFLQMT